MGQTLLELGDQMTALLAALDASGGEMTQEASQQLEQWFDQLSGAVEAKLDSYLALIRECSLRAAARRQEAERLAQRVSTDENTARRLKDRLRVFMEMQGRRSIETARYRVTVAANGGAVPVKVDCAPEELPAAYQRHRVEADVEALRTALLAGDRGRRGEAGGAGKPSEDQLTFS